MDFSTIISAKLTEAIHNNTIVIQKLVDRLDGEEGGKDAR